MIKPDKTGNNDYKIIKIVAKWFFLKIKKDEFHFNKIHTSKVNYCFLWIMWEIDISHEWDFSHDHSRPWAYL